MSFSMHSTPFLSSFLTFIGEVVVLSQEKKFEKKSQKILDWFYCSETVNESPKIAIIAFLISFDDAFYELDEKKKINWIRRAKIVISTAEIGKCAMKR